MTPFLRDRRLCEVAVERMLREMKCVDKDGREWR